MAMCDPMDFETIEALERQTGWSVAPMVAPQSSIVESIERYYSNTGRRRHGMEDGAPGAFPDLVREVEEAEVFGRQFSEVHDRLDRIDERLARIETLLAQRRGEE